ncbi:MAG: DNA polymerase [Burkholderiales bacterium RIFCSPLOWO2_02_FULL_57_36]|nr:MAG: DNA polymerase [Burkholderiales bacterium RIFCSPLOWO2_02_FULL_57_36]
MRLWIAVHLPLLPLETFRPRWCELGMHVVIEREQVLAMTPQADDGGVRIGMRRGGVSAIAPDATMHDRDAVKEQAALNGIAMSLLQYTPEVALAEDNANLLLDVTASLRVFGGRLALCRRVRTSVDAMGFTAQIGMAPTAQGAWLLACRRGNRSLARARRVIRMDSLTRRLDALPFTLLPAAGPYRDWLDGIGCRTLGDLRKLPRAGLQRRCGKDVLDALDRAYGDAPELFNWIEAPQTFSAKLELPDRIEHAEAVLFAARRLILQMVGWLTVQQLAVSRMVLFLEHERGRTAIEPTPVEIALAEPAWHEAHLIRLLKERLGRIELSGPVIAIRLEAVDLSAMMPPTESLFPEPGGTPADYHRLLELLTARLGADSVLAPAAEADHRPEISNQWRPAASIERFAPVMEMGPTRRPFWLLEKPLALLVREHRPFYGSPLQLINGPERIECGWWDDAFTARDYFIAQGNESACYWVYRQRVGDEIRWFLHGLFA